MNATTYDEEAHEDCDDSCGIHGLCCALESDVARLTRERDEARAERDRAKAKLSRAQTALRTVPEYGRVVETCRNEPGGCWCGAHLPSLEWLLYADDLDTANDRARILEAQLAEQLRRANEVHDVLQAQLAEERRRREEAESSAAAMREALEWYLADDKRSVEHEILESVERRPAHRALAHGAGAALLERVRKLEAVAVAAEDLADASYDCLLKVREILGEGI